VISEAYRRRSQGTLQPGENWDKFSVIRKFAVSKYAHFLSRHGDRVTAGSAGPWSGPAV